MLFEQNKTDAPETKDFRIFLQNELVRRCKENPRYSLRAFAKFLGVDPSRLFKMLKGDRPVKAEFIENFGQRIGLKPKTIEEFKLGAQTKKIKSDTGKTYDDRQLFLQLTQDTFEIISDWNHYAILELMEVDGFTPNSKWISRALSISPNEVNACIDRLVRVNLLTIDSHGKWHDNSGGFTTHILGNNYTSYAHQRSQEQVLVGAMRALKDVPIEKRDQSSMMMATNVDKIADAKKMITQFRRELCGFLNDTNKKNAVFQLSVSLFPVADASGANGEIKNSNENIEEDSK